MKFDASREWYAARAKLEGDAEVGAGLPGTFEAFVAARDAAVFRRIVAAVGPKLISPSLATDPVWPPNRTQP
jgi:hypothetical protein